MFTLRVWRVLRHPPHPHLYFHVANRSQPDLPVLSRAVLVAAGYILSCMVFTLLWPVFVTNGPSFLLAAAVCLNTTYAAAWAARAAGHIAHERAQGRFDLLCLTPPGALAANWACCSSISRHSVVFRSLSVVIGVVIIVLVAALPILFVFLLMMTTGANYSEIAEPFVIIVSSIALVLALFLDYAQAIALANLLGILVALNTDNGLIARLSAAGLLVLAQLAAHTATAVAGLVILPLLFGGAGITLTLFRFLTWLLLHETVVALAWTQLARQMRLTRGEFTALLRGTP